MSASPSNPSGLPNRLGPRLWHFAQARPNDIALIDGRGQVTFSELWVEATRALSHLKTLGLDGNRMLPVAFTAHATRESLFLLTALWSGSIPAVPLHPKWQHEQRHRALSHAPPHLFLGDDGVQSWPSSPSLSAVRALGTPGETNALLAAPASIVFTSGSSGVPKGVCLPESAHSASAEASAANLGQQPGDRWLLNLPLAHIGGLSIWFRALWAGMPCVLSPPGQTANEWLEWARATQVTLLSLVPTQLRAFEGALCQLPHLRAILVGGAALPPHQGERLERLGLPIFPTYGLTEAASQVATRSQRHPAPVGSVGKILPHLEGRIRDGILELRGESMFTGYWGEPARAKESWFCTRDRARLGDDGNLFILGRSDDVIITGGENVDPLVIESLLLELGAEQACVFGIPDEHWGQIIACVLAPATLDLPALKQILVSRLPKFMRPRRVLVQESLPLSPTGKLDRTHIVEQFRGSLVTW